MATKEQIEKYAGRNMGDFGADECTDLWGVYTALKNGQAKTEDYFPIEKDVPDPFADSRQAQIAKEASEVFDNVINE